MEHRWKPSATKFPMGMNGTYVLCCLYYHNLGTIITFQLMVIEYY